MTVPSLLLADLLGVGVCGQSEGVVVRGEGGGGAGVPGLGTRAQRSREVQPQIHGVAHLPWQIFLCGAANIFTAIYVPAGRRTLAAGRGAGCAGTRGTGSRSPWPPPPGPPAAPPGPGTTPAAGGTISLSLSILLFTFNILV